MLSACGEGSDDNTQPAPSDKPPVVVPPDTSEPLTPLEPSTPTKYREPQKDRADYYQLGFFD